MGSQRVCIRVRADPTCTSLRKRYTTFSGPWAPSATAASCPSRNAGTSARLRRYRLRLSSSNTPPPSPFSSRRRCLGRGPSTTEWTKTAAAVMTTGIVEREREGVTSSCMVPHVTACFGLWLGPTFRGEISDCCCCFGLTARFVESFRTFRRRFGLSCRISFAVSASPRLRTIPPRNSIAIPAQLNRRTVTTTTTTLIKH